VGHPGLSGRDAAAISLGWHSGTAPAALPEPPTAIPYNRLARHARRWTLPEMR